MTTWYAVLVALSGAPFLFHWLPDVTALQGFGIGWILAGIVCLVPAARKPSEHDA